MVCGTRSSYRLLRSAAATKNVQLLSIGSQRRARKRKVRSLALQGPENGRTSDETIEELVIAPEYEWIRAVYLKHGPDAMRLLLGMTRTDWQQVYWIP